MKRPLDSAGGRKFLLAVLCVVSVTGLTAFQAIEGGIYSVVMVAVIGSYIAGNVVQAVGLKP